MSDFPLDYSEKSLSRRKLPRPVLKILTSTTLNSEPIILKNRSCVVKVCLIVTKTIPSSLRFLESEGFLLAPGITATTSRPTPVMIPMCVTDIPPTLPNR